MSDQNVVPLSAPVDDAKKPWESKTILISSILGLVQVVSSFIPQAHVVSDWINSHGVAIGSVWAILAIVLRSVSSGSIALRD